MKNFNIIICGIGGQGIITLLKILAKAALAEGFNVKSSELHGLSQRGGSIVVHLKIGKEIHSPLILPGQADFVLGLGAQEALRNIEFSNPNTTFLVNKQIIPLEGSKLTLKKIKSDLCRVSKKACFIDATCIAEEKLKNPVVAGVLLLAYASYKKFIPVSLKSITQSTKEIVGAHYKKYQELNLKAIKLARKL